MKAVVLASGALAVAAGAAILWAVVPAPREGAPPEGAAMVEVALPAEMSAEAQIGQRAFEAKCAACHGENAAGRQGTAPPLVHEIYEPGHHSDMAFVLAAKNGVRAHHWRFGDMPPVEGLTDAEVMAIARYVRALQRENGIL